MYQQRKPLLPLGVRHIGENRVDKFFEKYQAFKKTRNITWHLIGTLQRRKVKDVIQYVGLFPRFGFIKASRRNSKEVTELLSVSYQVNISREESKHGFQRKNYWNYFARIGTLDKIEYVGLMTMAPFEARQ